MWSWCYLSVNSIILGVITANKIVSALWPQMSLLCITFCRVKRSEARESALVRVVAPKDHWHEVSGWQDDGVPRSAFGVLLLLATEPQGFISLRQNLVWQGQRPLSTDSCAESESGFLQHVPGCSRIHTGGRVPRWSGWSRLWPCDRLGRWCSTLCAGCQGMAGGSWGRWSCHTALSAPHSATHGGGRTRQVHNAHWAKLGVLPVVPTIISRKEMLSDTHLVMLALRSPDILEQAHWLRSEGKWTQLSWLADI